MQNSIHALKAGSHGEPILFIHGFPMTGHIWDKQLSTLSSHFRCFALELPGYGQSPEPKNFAPSINTFADSVADFIRGNTLSPVHIAGISLGGMIAMNIARRHPDVLKSLILLHTTAASDSAALQSQRTDIIKHIKRGGLDAFATDFADVLIGPNTKPQVRADYIRMMKGASPDVVIKGMKALRDRHAETPYLSDIAVPTLVVAGDQDKRTKASMMQKFAAQIPNSTYKLIKDCGHVSPIEQPEILSALLGDWLNAF